jgi:hypothetical protein
MPSFKLRFHLIICESQMLVASSRVAETASLYATKPRKKKKKPLRRELFVKSSEQITRM